MARACRLAGPWADTAFMTIRLSARLISFAILGLLAIAALVLVLYATPEGLGLSDDSIAYIAGARSMLAGHGYREAWLASNGPVTHFPPAYPAALVSLGWFGLDPLRGARLVNAALFALSTFVMGILGWRMTRSLLAGLILATLFLANGSLLQVYASALSEPLFIFLSLLAFWMFDLYFERDAHWLWLVSCGVLVGLAYLTRYAALGLAVTFLIALMLLHRTWAKRWQSAAIFLVGLVPWAAGWAIRNVVVGGTATNRKLVWHPITAGNFDTALRTISEFLVPVEPWRAAWFRVPGLFLSLVSLILGLILVWIVVKVTKGTREARAASLSVISLTNALYVFCYLAAIFVAMSWFDASTKFKLRILAPEYVSLLILLLVAGRWGWGRRRELALALAVAIVGVSTFGQYAAVTGLRKGGQGYASFRWYDSRAMAFLRSLPADVMIYTNEPGAVYLYTGRGTYVLPDRLDPVTAEARPGFDQGRAELQAEVKSGRAVLALFGGGDTPPADTMLLSQGLHLTEKSEGAEIYAASP
jgi:4-amino-4-deoxy-L-arabinose transferase-like glycosyltransferase